MKDALVSGHIIACLELMKKIKKTNLLRQEDRERIMNIAKDELNFLMDQGLSMQPDSSHNNSSEEDLDIPLHS